MAWNLSAVLVASLWLSLAWGGGLQDGSAPSTWPGGQPWHEAGTDPTVAPGDDFFAYANGGWLQTTKLPAGRERWNARDEVAAKAQANLGDVFQHLKQAPTGSLGRKVEDFRQAYQDAGRAKVEARTALAAEFRGIDRIRTIKDLAKHLGTNIGRDVDPLGWSLYTSAQPFGLSVEPGLQGEPTQVPYLFQGGLGLGDQALYLAMDAAGEAKRTEYRAYLRDLFQLAGFPEAERRAAAVFDMEMALSRCHVSAEASDDLKRASQAWTRDTFQREAPTFPWTVFLEAAGLGSEPRLVVWQPEAIRGTATLVVTLPLDTWRDYLRVHLLDHYGAVLPVGIQARYRSFHGGAKGSEEAQSEAATTQLLPEAMSQLYVERHFRPEWKAGLQRMVIEVAGSLRGRVATLTWMTPSARAIAEAKLQNYYFSMGYPDRWTDHRALSFRPDDAVGNLRRLEAWRLQRLRARLGRPVDVKEWWMPAFQAQAVLIPFQSVNNFAAGLLQPPKFDPTWPEAAQYGAIGSIVGHEISHYVDPIGADFDHKQRMRPWWSAADKAAWERVTEPLARQFSSYRPLPDVAVDGQRSIGENVADLGGLAAAFEAYRARLGPKAKGPEDLRRMDREFFLGYARAWRSVYSEPGLRRQLATDTHAPDRYRVATVRNLDAWYEAFDVKPGHRLYLEPSARLRVW
jgi:endothelin-converting enzyme/putative endopeptidase